MSTFTLPQSGNVNVYYDSLPTGVAVPANTLHLYQLNNPGGGVDAYTKAQSDAKYVKYDNGGITQFVNGPMNIATETITPQIHIDGTKDTIITATPSATDRTQTIPATDSNTEFIMANPTTAQTIQKKITTPQSIVTGTGVDIYGTTALTGRHTIIKQNLSDTANAAPTLNIPGITDAGATGCEVIVSHPSHDQAINANISTKNATLTGKAIIKYTSENAQSAVNIDGFGLGHGWACTMTPSAGIETDGTEYYRFMDQNGTLTRGVFRCRIDTSPAITVVAYKGAWESQTNTNFCNEIVTSITTPTNRQMATALATKTYTDTGLGSKLNSSALVTVINASSTDAQIASAKATKTYVDQAISSTGNFTKVALKLRYDLNGNGMLFDYLVNGYYYYGTSSQKYVHIPNTYFGGQRKVEVGISHIEIWDMDQNAPTGVMLYPYEESHEYIIIPNNGTKLVFGDLTFNTSGINEIKEVQNQSALPNNVNYHIVFPTTTLRISV